MRHNRVLSVAIATALSMGATSAYAGVLTVGYGDTNGGAINWDKAPTFASEYFLNAPERIVPDATNAVANTLSDDLDATQSIDALDDFFLYAQYKMETVMSENFLARFTLSNGATLGSSISLASGADKDFIANVSGTHVATTFSSTFGQGGKAGDSQVTFLVQAAGSESVDDQTLLLRYSLKGLTALSTPGARVDMTVNIFDPSGNIQTDDKESDHAATKTVVQSARGAALSLQAATGGITQVDVTTGSLNFTGDIVSSTIASLGTLEINSPQPNVIKDTGANWVFATDIPKPASATLTVTDGNFFASIATPGRVFLDVDNNGNFDDSSTTMPDLAATVDADGLTATWDLTPEQLKTLVGGTVPILVEADGSSEINDAKEAPLATLSLDYGGGVKDTISGKLRQIKRNGTVCTLYNVPNPNAIDEGNIRITNTSGKAAKIRGSLRDLNGRTIFNNQVLVESVATNETVRLTQVELDGIAKNADWLTFWQADTAHNSTGGESGWQGRAVLTISGDVSSMEVYGLVRSKAGGPLTNMSVGGTGSGCD